MHNLGSEQVTWYTYASVENNDYRMVDHTGYTSFVFLRPKVAEKQLVEFQGESKINREQTISTFCESDDLEEQ